MKADLVVRNGRLFDPSQNLDMVGDVAIVNGKIEAIGPNLDVAAAMSIDASGCLVTAGWIDIHAHIYEGSTPNGMPVDLGALPMGITAIVDAGSSGVASYRNLLRQLRANKTRGKLMLNVSACGIIMPNQFPEPVDPKVWDQKLFEKAYAECGEDMIALKLRVSRGIVGALGLEPLHKAIEAAERLGTKLVVHVTDGPAPMREIAAILRPGDVFCHVFHGTGHTILTPEGKVDPGIYEARERGVIFDASSGRGNFSLRVARAAIEQGFLPDSISTDVTLQNWNHPLAGQLPTVMSRYLPLGMSLADIISCVTDGPAVQFGTEGLGTLALNTPADITVAKMEQTSKRYVDKDGDSVDYSELFIPKATIVRGELWYRAVDCALL
ncbi:MAG: hypothetical protein GX417_05010 [Clostridiales bacterium]|nr:hypothetical protein [Clostridiales bacterium]